MEIVHYGQGESVRVWGAGPGGVSSVVLWWPPARVTLGPLGAGRGIQAGL